VGYLQDLNRDARSTKYEVSYSAQLTLKTPN